MEPNTLKILDKVIIQDDPITTVDNLDQFIQYFGQNISHVFNNYYISFAFKSPDIGGGNSFYLKFVNKPSREIENDHSGLSEMDASSRLVWVIKEGLDVTGKPVNERVYFDLIVSVCKTKLRKMPNRHNELKIQADRIIDFLSRNREHLI